MASVTETSVGRIKGQRFIDSAKKKPQDFARERKMPSKAEGPQMLSCL